MIAPNTINAVPLSPGEEQAIAALYARQRAIAASEPNRRAHALVRAARELLERVALFIEDVPADAAATVLAAAGLDDPESMSRYGSSVFSEIHEKASELEEALGDFILIAGNDLPEPPAERAAA